MMAQIKVQAAPVRPDTAKHYRYEQIALWRGGTYSLITIVPVSFTGSLSSAPNSRPTTSPARFSVLARTMSGVPGRPDNHTTSLGPVETAVPRGPALDSTRIAEKRSSPYVPSGPGSVNHSSLFGRMTTRSAVSVPMDPD